MSSFFIERNLKMNEINNIITTIAPYVCMLAVAIVAVYPSLKKHNPDLASKTKWIYDIAQALVADQATKEDVDGAEKKQAATDALLDQAKKSNTKITRATAEGLIQKAYDEKQKVNTTSSIDDVQGFAYDDEEEGNSNMANEPTDSTVEDGNDSNDNVSE